MRFLWKITPTIMDGLVVRWELEHWTAEISASKNGVLISGSWPTMQDTVPVTSVLFLAAACHKFIRDAYAERPLGGPVDLYERVKKWLATTKEPFASPSEVS